MIDKFFGPYRFLSNFYPAPVELDGMTFPTNENAYQAAKTKDLEARKPFQLVTAPIAKKMGQKLLLHPDWEEIKVEIMRGLVISKFEQHSKLAVRLAATYPQSLVEGNTWHDNFWGACTCPRCAPLEKKNTLGKILEEVRSRFSGAQENGTHVARK